MEIREIRLRLRKTQQEFSALLGISQSQLVWLEKKIRQPNEGVLEKIQDLESDAIYMPELEDSEKKKCFSIGVINESVLNKFNTLKAKEDLSSPKLFEKLIDTYIIHR